MPEQQVPGHVEVVLREERLRIGHERLPYERVVLRRRLITETRTVEVTVRREELSVEHLSADGAGAGQAFGSAATREPLVLVLSEEVPVVEVRTRPYETVTVSVVAVEERTEVTVDVAREQVEVLGAEGRGAR